MSVPCVFTQQGPPGKDGLPGHPGQRGETVSGSMASHVLLHVKDLLPLIAPLSLRRI